MISPVDRSEEFEHPILMDRVSTELKRFDEFNGNSTAEAGATVEFLTQIPRQTSPMKAVRPGTLGHTEPCEAEFTHLPGNFLYTSRTFSVLFTARWTSVKESGRGYDRREEAMSSDAEFNWMLGQ